VLVSGLLSSKRALVLVLCSFYTSLGYAQQMCVPYNSGSNVTAAMQLVDGERVDKAKQALTGYIKAAASKDQDVFRYVTKLDGSDSHIRTQLRSTPDLFSSYSAIRGFEVNQMFAFGNYVMFYANYDHAKGSGLLLETVLCTNICQVSNIMERPTPSEDAASRYFQQLRINKSRVSECKEPSGVISQVSPSVTFNVSAPLSIAYDIPSTSSAIANLSALDWGSPSGPQQPSSCQSLLDTTFKGRNDDPQREPLDEKEAAAFITECTANMKISSTIPVLNVSTGKREFFLSYTFANLMANATSFKKISTFSESGTDVVILEVEAQGKRLVVMPFIKSGNKRVIDWNFYGSAVGEALTTVPFISYYRQVKS
jgi:hypothetical protein